MRPAGSRRHDWPNQLLRPALVGRRSNPTRYLCRHVAAFGRGGPVSARGGAKVLEFPTPKRTDDRPLILAWYRCAGGCGALVTSPAALCLSCAVEASDA